MRQNGFSVVEMLVVMAIVAALLGMATLKFGEYSKKAAMESQTRTMYADIMEARSQALLQKTGRSVSVYATQYIIQDGSGAPILQKALKYPVTFDYSDTIAFDTRGMADGTKTVCIDTAGNPAVIDSISITAMMIQMGKRGGTCDSAHFTAK